MYLTYDTTIFQNDDASLCNDVINTPKKFKINKFDDFSSDIDFHSETDVFRHVTPLIINQCEPMRPRASPADIKSPPAALLCASEACLSQI